MWIWGRLIILSLCTLESFIIKTPQPPLSQTLSPTLSPSCSLFFPPVSYRSTLLRSLSLPPFQTLDSSTQALCFPQDKRSTGTNTARVSAQSHANMTLTELVGHPSFLPSSLSVHHCITDSQLPRDTTPSLMTYPSPYAHGVLSFFLLYAADRKWKRGVLMGVIRSPVSSSTIASLRNACLQRKRNVSGM